MYIDPSRPYTVWIRASSGATKARLSVGSPCTPYCTDTTSQAHTKIPFHLRVPRSWDMAKPRPRSPRLLNHVSVEMDWNTATIPLSERTAQDQGRCRIQPVWGFLAVLDLSRAARRGARAAQPCNNAQRMRDWAGDTASNRIDTNEVGTQASYI